MHQIKIFDLVIPTDTKHFLNWLLADLEEQTFMPLELRSGLSVSAGGHEIIEPNEYSPHTYINLYGLFFEESAGEVVMLEPEIIKTIEIRQISKSAIQVLGWTDDVPGFISWVNKILKRIDNIFPDTKTVSAGFQEFPSNESWEEEEKNKEVKPKKRTRGPSPDILAACKDGMSYWLDEDKSLIESANFAGIDKKTLQKWIPNVLDLTEVNKRKEWIEVLKALKKDKLLGKYRED